MRTHRLFCQTRSALFFIFLAVGTASAGESTVGKWHWVQSDGTVALKRDGVALWQLNCDQGERKPNFHPLNLPGIGTLTWKSPPDHPWHLALWFSWKYINGVNYWEENRRTGRPEGLTEWDVAKVTCRPDWSASIEMALAYHPPGAKPVLREKRVMEVSAPDPEGRYHIDWRSTFTAGEQAVELDRTPLPGEPGGKEYGGYAGLSVRFAENFVDWKAVDSDGKIDEQAVRIRTQARAVDYSGTIEGTPCGIAIFDHPNNLPAGEAPTPWYIIQSPRQPMAYFSPAVIQQKPRTIPAGESMTLKYRILVHAGRMDADSLKKEYQRFIGSTAATGGERRNIR